MTILSVYSDGASHGRKNLPGGYGFVIVRDGLVIRCGYGGHPKTSNNLMELQGAIEGLKVVIAEDLAGDDLVELVSDSTYVLGNAQGIYAPVANFAECTLLRELASQLRATTRWVKGHAGELWNERCDSLARRGKVEAKAKMLAEEE